MFHVLHCSTVLGMNEDLWDRVSGLGSETRKDCTFVFDLSFQYCSHNDSSV